MKISVSNLKNDEVIATVDSISLEEIKALMENHAIGPSDIGLWLDYEEGDEE